MRELWRIAQWGLLGTAALIIAVYAGSTETGRDRIRQAAGQLHQLIKPSDGKLAQPFDAEEGKRLAETVRLLAADRDRLLARIAALEHSVDKVTGSIAPADKPAQAAQHPPPPEPAAAPAAAAPATSEPAQSEQTPSEQITSEQITSEPATSQSATSERTTSAPAEDVTSSINPPTAMAVPTSQPAPAPPAKQPTAARPATAHPPAPNAVTHAKFGIELGSADTIEDLGALWKAIRQRHPAQLDGLRPVAHVYQRTWPPWGSEMRLVAGPIATAAVAARLCGALAAAGVKCQPVTDDGRRLAGR